MMCRDRHELLAQRRSGLADRAGEHRAAAAATGARPERRDGRVALDRADVLDLDAERIGGELDDGGLEAVAARTAGDVHVDLARRLDADRRTFGAVEPGAR